jgi:parvulin-like peptidyl-prolyl isomerase
VVLVVACGSRPAPVTAPPPGAHGVEAAEPAAPTEAPPPQAPVVNLDIDSKDVLARDDEADESFVKHVLIGWKDLESAYNGALDPRAKARTQAEAAQLATKIADDLRRDVHGLDAAIKQYSEDPGSLALEPYDVKPTEPFVPEFKSLALRLAIDEVGIVKTRFGYHVIVRVAPPPPDPVQSNDILGRAADPGPVFIRYIALPWDADTKADADKRATALLAEVRKGGDLAKLAAKYSTQFVSKDTEEIAADAQLPEGFKSLALRLKVNEAGLVSEKHTWIVIKRVAPPKPDALESTAIMARKPTTEHAKVKHILVGWAEVNADDPRAKKRTRKELDKLVKDTVKKLKKGAAIEPLMKELSEDPGSADSGEAYDVTPDAGLVEPFKKLSLRLQVGEVGVVKTQFGIHIIERTE